MVKETCLAKLYIFHISFNWCLSMNYELQQILQKFSRTLQSILDRFYLVVFCISSLLLLSYPRIFPRTIRTDKYKLQRVLPKFSCYIIFFQLYGKIHLFQTLKFVLLLLIFRYFRVFFFFSPAFIVFFFFFESDWQQVCSDFKDSNESSGSKDTLCHLLSILAVLTILWSGCSRHIQWQIYFNFFSWWPFQVPHQKWSHRHHHVP